MGLSPQYSRIVKRLSRRAHNPKAEGSIPSPATKKNKGVVNKMDNSFLRTVSTIELVRLINEASNKGEQNLVNVIAYELTYRIWVPNQETTFEEMLKRFGYISPQEAKEKKKKTK